MNFLWKPWFFARCFRPRPRRDSARAVAWQPPRQSPPWCPARCRQVPAARRPWRRELVADADREANPIFEAEQSTWRYHEGIRDHSMIIVSYIVSLSDRFPPGNWVPFCLVVWLLRSYFHFELLCWDLPPKNHRHHHHFGQLGWTKWWSHVCCLRTFWLTSLAQWNMPDFLTPMHHLLGILMNSLRLPSSDHQLYVSLSLSLPFSKTFDMAPFGVHSDATKDNARHNSDAPSWTCPTWFCR